MPSECCKATWAKIPDDEPVFILRGKDLTAATSIASWLETAALAGTNPEKLEAARGHLDAFLRFQKDNPERCKFPD